VEAEVAGSVVVSGEGAVSLSEKSQDSERAIA